MSKIKKVQIPHNVKERFRHQNLQRLLEDVASHVPRLPSLKNETKAKKLRRIVLYMRFLLQKHAELPNHSTADTTINSIPEISDIKEDMNKKEKGKEKGSKVLSELKSCPPQIVFLRKMSDRKRSLSVTETNAEATGFKEIELECKRIKKAGKDGITLKDTDPSYFIEFCQESSRMFGNYSPFFDAKQLPSEFCMSGGSKINTDVMEKPPLSAFARPWERNAMDQWDDSSIEKKSTESWNSVGDTLDPTRLLYKENHHLVLKENSCFGIRNSAETSDEERNVYCAEISDFNKKYAVFRPSTKDKLPPVSTFVPSSTQKDNVDQEIYSDSFYSNLSNANDDVQNHVSFSREAGNYPFEFFSSEECVPITSSGESVPIASSGESAPIVSSEWFSSDEMEYGNLIEKTAPEPSNAKNIPQGVVVGDSLNSCDIYNNPPGTFCDMGQYMNIYQDNMQANMYEHYGDLMGDFHSDLTTPPDRFKYISDYNAPGHDAFQNAAHHTEIDEDNFSRQQSNQDFFHGAQGFVESSSIKTIPEQVNNNVLSDKYFSISRDNNALEMSKFGAKSECKGYIARQSECCSSSEFERSATPKFFAKPDDTFVPQSPSTTMNFKKESEDDGFFGDAKFRVQNRDLGCQGNGGAPEFGHSSFRVGSECYSEVKVEQEDIEPQLFANEISFSLNNLDSTDWYREYFNVP